MSKEDDTLLANARKEELLGRSSPLATFGLTEWQSEAASGERHYDMAINMYRAALRACRAGASSDSHFALLTEVEVLLAQGDWQKAYDLVTQYLKVDEGTG